jgi:hypothetical protein
MCFDSSLILANLLRCAGYDAYVIGGFYGCQEPDYKEKLDYDSGDPHAWIELNDPDDEITWIVDITRTQFVEDSDSVFIRDSATVGYEYVVPKPYEKWRLCDTQMTFRDLNAKLRFIVDMPEFGHLFKSGCAEKFKDLVFKGEV